MNPLWRMLMIVLLAVALPAHGLPMASMRMHGAVGLSGLSTVHDVVQAEKGHPRHITDDGYAQSGSDCTDTAPCVSFCTVIGALSSPAMPLGTKGMHILAPAQESVYISAVPVPLERPPRVRSIQLYGSRLFAVRHPYSGVSEYATQIAKSAFMPVPREIAGASP